jgi:hypothetical protein
MLRNGPKPSGDAWKNNRPEDLGLSPLCSGKSERQVNDYGGAVAKIMPRILLRRECTQHNATMRKACASHRG